MRKKWKADKELKKQSSEDKNKPDQMMAFKWTEVMSLRLLTEKELTKMAKNMMRKKTKRQPSVLRIRKKKGYSSTRSAVMTSVRLK